MSAKGTCQCEVSTLVLERLKREHPEVKVIHCTAFEGDYLLLTVESDQLSEGAHGMQELSFVDGGVRFKRWADA